MLYLPQRGLEDLISNLDVVDGRLVFRPYSYPSDSVRSAGFTWSKSDRVWRGPATGYAARFVLLQFPGTHLTTNVEHLLTIPPLPPMPDLQPHQPEAVLQLLAQSSGGGVLLALAPRLGKAVVTIRAALVANKQHVLILSPLSLLYNWQRKICLWGKQPESDVKIFKGKRPEPTHRWAITNYDTVRTKGAAEGFDLIVLDESVLLKNRKAQRTKAAAKVRRSNITAPVWALSGSPRTKHLDDLWSQLNIIDPFRFPSYWRFADQYCVLEKDQWGTRITDDRPDAEKQLKQDLRHIYFSLAQEDISDKKPFSFERIYVPLAPKQERMYTTMAAEFWAQIGDLPEDAVLAPNVLIQLLRCLQIASNPALIGGPDISPKADAVLELLECRPLPVVVWTNFIVTAERLTARIRAKGYRTAMLTGATPAEERQTICDSFQNGGLDVLVAHPKVGKFGLELFAAKSAIFAERGYDSDDFYQALHRIRLPESPTSHIVLLLSAGTVDETVDGVLRKSYTSTQRLTAKMLKEEILEEEICG